MKKYIFGLMLALAVTGFAAQAHAVTFDDLLQEVNNLKQQVFDLRTQLGAAVSRATMSATTYQSASTLKASDVPATLQQATSGTGGTASPTSGTGTTGGTTSGTTGATGTGGQMISAKATIDAEAGLEFGDIDETASIIMGNDGLPTYAVPNPTDPAFLNLRACWNHRYSGAYVLSHPKCGRWLFTGVLLASPRTNTNQPGTTVQSNVLTKPEVPTSYIVSQQPTAVAAGVTFTRNLTIGERSAEVKKLQDVLVSKGYLAGDNATGLYGKATAAAVMALQRANGINDDGTVVGPKTQLLLNGGASAQAQIPTGTGTPASSILPPGCTSFFGYSTVNGQPCGANIQVAPIGWVCQFNPNAAPKLKVTSPDGGEIYAAGQQLTATWKTCNIPNTATFNVFLYVPSIGADIQLNASPVVNDGSEVFTIPASLPVYGTYFKVKIALNTSGTQLMDVSDNLFTINTPVQQVCGIVTPTVLSASSTQSQYVAAGGMGSTDATKATYRFTASGGTSTITELKFAVSGLNSVTSVRVGNVSAPVVAGVAWLVGLNIAVPNGGNGVDVDVYTSYSTVGIAGINPDTDSTVFLTQVKYICGGVSTTITPSVPAPTMTMVGSKPIVVTNTGSYAGLVLNADNKIGEVTITADSHGNIKINDLVFQPASSNINAINFVSPRIVNGSVTVAGSSCSFTSGRIGCEFGTSSNNDYDGYMIAAGTSTTFSLYATVTGTSTGSNSAVATSISANYFNWDDTSTNGASGKNLSGILIYNFPMGSYSIHQ